METDVGGQVHYPLKVTRKRVMKRHTLLTLQNGRILSVPQMSAGGLPIRRKKGMEVVDGQVLKKLPKIGDTVDMFMFGDEKMYSTFTAYLFEFKGVRIASMVERTPVYHNTRGNRAPD